MHPQSKYIDKISYTNMYYLTDTLKKTITEQDFNLTTGKPLNNIQKVSAVDDFF